LNINGLLRRDGTLTLDVAGDFDAAIGDEFEIIRTSGGFNIDGFDTVSGFVIDDTRSIALIESGNSSTVDAQRSASRPGSAKSEPELH